MYDKINTANDVIRERYIYGAEIVGKYGFPQLPVCNPNLSGVKAVPFNLANKEREPKKAVCHFSLTTTFSNDIGITRKNTRAYWRISDVSVRQTFHFMTVCRWR